MPRIKIERQLLARGRAHQRTIQIPVPRMPSERGLVEVIQPWCHAATAVPTTAPLLAARGLGPVPRLCIRPARQPVHPASGGACTGGGRGRLRRLCRSRRGAVQDLGGRRRAPPQPPTKCHRSRSLRPATAASQCALSSGAARPECVLAQPEPAGLGSGSQASELWHHQGGPLTVVATRCRRVPVQLRVDEGALRQVV